MTLTSLYNRVYNRYYALRLIECIVLFCFVLLWTCLVSGMAAVHMKKYAYFTFLNCGLLGKSYSCMLGAWSLWRQNCYTLFYSPTNCYILLSLLAFHLIPYMSHYWWNIMFYCTLQYPTMFYLYFFPWQCYAIRSLSRRLFLLVLATEIPLQTQWCKRCHVLFLFKVYLNVFWNFELMSYLISLPLFSALFVPSCTGNKIGWNHGALRGFDREVQVTVTRYEKWGQGKQGCGVDKQLNCCWCVEVVLCHVMPCHAMPCWLWSSWSWPHDSPLPLCSLHCPSVLFALLTCPSPQCKAWSGAQTHKACTPS